MKLPRYVVAKDGGKRFYFEIPKAQRPKDWPPSIRLPNDPVELMQRGKELNKRLDDIRAKRAEAGYNERGSLEWLMEEWRKSPEWANIKPKTQQFYEDGWKHVTRWSQKNKRPNVAGIKWPTIHKLVSVYTDRPGVQRQVINVLQRLFQIAHDRGIIEENPWADQKRRRWQSKKAIQAKQTVTWREVEQMARICDEAGFPSMGTAVMIGFDIMQYPEDITGMRFGEHYNAKEGVFTFDRAKTGIPAIVPASDDLRDRIGQADRMFLVVYEKTGQPYTRRHFNRIFREIMQNTPYAAFQFRWLRHSGVKEADAAGLDERAIDAMGAWKPGGSGKAVRDAHYRNHSADLAKDGMNKRERFRNA